MGFKYFANYLSVFICNHFDFNSKDCKQFSQVNIRPVGCLYVALMTSLNDPEIYRPTCIILQVFFRLCYGWD